MKKLPDWIMKKKGENKPIEVDGDYLVLNYSYPYEISLDRIDTPEKILGWVCHLSEKNWMNANKISTFVDICGEINRVNYRSYN